jgi:hypothetical protein
MICYLKKEKSRKCGKLQEKLGKTEKEIKSLFE